MTDRRPVIRGPEDAWQRLGELLQLRRAELGYKRRPAFVKERGINIRLVTDIENAYRPNTFLTPTLREIAAAYRVTYDSVVAVILGHDDELIPAPAAAPRGPGEPPAWMAAEPDRTAANRPYADRIRGRLAMLRAQGTRAPSGAELFPDSAADARDWDKYGDWEEKDRVWFIADLQRREVGRAPNSGTGTGA